MLEHFVKEITQWVSHYGYWGIFVLMLFENVGAPLPTEIGFIVGQAMVSTGKSSYGDIFIVILAGKTIGSIISYFLGRFFADKIKFLKESSGLKRSQKTFHGWMKKYGSFAVFISRLIGYVRPWSSYLAGIGEIKLVPFLLYNIAGSALIIVLTLIVLGGAVEIWRAYPLLRPLAVILFCIFFFGFWIGLWIYNKLKAQNVKRKTITQNQRTK